LNNLETDGTRDQHRPLKVMMDSPNPGHKFSSFDLSAATDRLPIDIQIDILNNIIPGIGQR